jgi:hypothetical protein
MTAVVNDLRVGDTVRWTVWRRIANDLRPSPVHMDGRIESLTANTATVAYRDRGSTAREVMLRRKLQLVKD